MPWPKKNAALGCCIYCKQEMRISVWWQGFSWCKCAGADTARKKLKNDHNREWHRRNQAAKGHTVKPQSERVARRKTPPAELRQRAAVTGVKIRLKRNVCKMCGNPTINRFNCRTCLSRVGDIFDLSVAVEPGYTRHIGGFVRTD